MMTIDDFHGDYYFLSNYYPSQVEYEGILYPTVEHAFQAAKTLDVVERQRVAGLDTPNKAKQEGQRLNIRTDWEDVKVGIMKELVTKKFKRVSLLNRLLKTGEAELIEGNWWNDTFWGVCKGVGKNNLGKILMEVRAELCV